MRRALARWFWSRLCRAECALGHPAWMMQFFEYGGYRQARGGRWERWEVDLGGPFLVWWRFDVDREWHQPLPLATGDLPLAVEVYRES